MSNTAPQGQNGCDMRRRKIFDFYETAEGVTILADDGERAVAIGFTAPTLELASDQIVTSITSTPSWAPARWSREAF